MPSPTSPTTGGACINLRAVPIFMKALVVAATALTITACAANADNSGCDKVASPSGSDSAAGTAGAPYRTAQKLSDSLAAGQTGCLRSGTYNEDLRVGHGGSNGAPLTVRSYPGERARLVGRLWIARGSDYVTIASLDLDGVNADRLPSPTVNSGNATFVDNDVTNDHTAICFVLGNSGYGRATNTLIARNRIHDCGVLPAKNHDHGIYVSDADDTKIIGNLIYDNADRGIQLYPDAQRTLVQGNVIDNNGVGVIFSGDGGQAANNNTVENNVITNSNQRNNVESWYPDGNPIGTGNVLRNNCISGGVRDSGNGGIGEQQGFTATSNITVDPHYANRSIKDFTLPAVNPCAAILAGAPAPNIPTTVAPPAGSGGSRGNGANGANGASKGPTGTRRVTVITFRGKAVRGGRLHLLGRVRSGDVRAASAAPRRVTIQLRWGGVWFPLASVAVRGDRYSSTVRLPRYLRSRLLTMRAMVPQVGTSKRVHVRAKR